MFAMVLAIGLLVDDAIVVVENVERVMSEEGLPPREATRKSMDQITGALIGIALVLSAVFVPMAFFGGSTGAIYRQFSITLVSAMGLSVAVALILTPALCAGLLKPVERGHAWETKGFFGWFNRAFESGPLGLWPQRGGRSGPLGPDAGDLRRTGGGHGPAVHPGAHIVPARRGSGHPVHAGGHPRRRHPRPAPWRH